MLYAERHRPRGVGLAGAVHRTWAVAGKNDWQFSNPRIDTGVKHKSQLHQHTVGVNTSVICHSHTHSLILVFFNTQPTVDSLPSMKPDNLPMQTDTSCRGPCG